MSRSRRYLRAATAAPSLVVAVAMALGVAPAAAQEADQGTPPADTTTTPTTTTEQATPPPATTTPAPPAQPPPAPPVEPTPPPAAPPAPPATEPTPPASKPAPKRRARKQVTRQLHEDPPTPREHKKAKKPKKPKEPKPKRKRKDDDKADCKLRAELRHVGEKRDDRDKRAEKRCKKHKKKKHKKKKHNRHHAGAPPVMAPAPGTLPGFIGLPGPSTAIGVPNFIIRKFRVPPFLLPIYQAAGMQYGVRWEVLAAINEIETDYGRNLNVSSAGAVGWMQFLPSSWRRYGTDANRDGRRDPYNPVDAIFAAARYLKAAGYGQDVRRAIFAYNHADWYVDSVMLRARLIAGVPADLVGSLTGLTEGRFPVYARARYSRTHSEDRRGIDIFAREGSPVVAVNDGVIKKIGRNERLGLYVQLQDAYGNRYTYARLGSVSRVHPVLRADALAHRRAERPARDRHDPAPTAPASAGRQRTTRPAATVPLKRRLFAHPERRVGGPRSHDRRFQIYDQYFSRPFGVDSSKVRLKRLRVGSRVIGGTILGRVAHAEGAPLADRAADAPAGRRARARLYFEIRPAGRGAPRIDPKPILDGWRLLEASALLRASGRNLSIGQIMLMPKPLLERRVLSDDRIEMYQCGRDDLLSGQIDRRVLATLEYLAESGLNPTITSLKCGHGFFTASGNVSEHSSGNAVDIAAINGVPILGHQESGGLAEQTVRRLMLLQGTMRPHQIISLLDLGGNTMALGDHADHIHVGFSPTFVEGGLRPTQWSDLIGRLGQIENPRVPTRPSRYAIAVDRGHERGPPDD